MRILDKQILERTIQTTSLADIESGKVGGIALAVFQDGETIYQKCFGNKELGINVTEHTLFRIASMTKPITAVAILRLAECGKLHLDTPISCFIPEFSQMDIGTVEEKRIKVLSAAKTPITIRHLLTHSSGLDGGPVGEYLRLNYPVRERTSLKRVVDLYTKNPLDFEPSTAQAYSVTHAFDVLARIVEIVSGKTYDLFLEKEIFDPLEMYDTTFSPTKEQWERMIPMHTYEEGLGKKIGFPEDSLFQGYPTSCCCGAAGLASTLHDYKNFAIMLLNHGKWKGKQILHEETVRDMSTPQLSSSIMNGSEIWGLGVRVIVDDSDKNLPYGAYGWSGAYGTHFWIDPLNGIVAIYLKNSRYDGGAAAKTSRQFERDVYMCLKK